MFTNFVLVFLSLFFVSGLGFGPKAEALVPAPILIAQSSSPSKQTQAPQSVVQRAIKDLALRTKIPANQIKVKSTKPQTWPDGCLGLSRPDELCTQALVSGWQVVLTSGQKTWTYRSNQQGNNLRLEN